MTSDERLVDIEAEIKLLRNDITEQIQGSMDATAPGLASRLQSVESEVGRHDVGDIKQRLAILENNSIQDGKARMVTNENGLASHARIIWTIGSAMVTAIIGALLAVILK